MPSEPFLDGAAEAEVATGPETVVGRCAPEDAAGAR